MENQNKDYTQEIDPETKNHASETEGLYESVYPLFFYLKLYLLI